MSLSTQSQHVSLAHSSHSDSNLATPRVSFPIMLMRCRQCAAHASLSPVACLHCGCTAFDSVAASGKGQVRARSEVWRAPDAFWRTYVPYTLVLVRLEEGPTIMAHADPDVAIGNTVTASIMNREGRHVLLFRL